MLGKSGESMVTVGGCSVSQMKATLLTFLNYGNHMLL